MRKQVLAISALLGFTQVNAQETTLWPNTSLEASYGYNAPINPTNDYTGLNKIKTADYASFSNLQLGLTYQINEKWGVRGTYMLAKFENTEIKKLGSQMHKLAIDAMYTLYDGTNNQFGNTGSQKGFITYAHAGLGLSLNKGEVYNQEDFMGNLQLGVKPTYQFNNRFGIFLNPIYILNFSQNHGFDGRFLDANSKSKIGSYYTVNIGLQVKLGK